uniref:Uncharacterized protein n=1 Tax=Rhizophora mucronata TaxID=61149 RepID=A0A2P2MY45_RHIMU
MLPQIYVQLSILTIL